MTTMELNATREIDPETILEQMREKRARRARTARQLTERHYEISREAGAFTVLMYGLGFLVFVVGLCTGLLSVPHAFVGAIAIWVLAVALRSYSGRMVHRDMTDYEPEFRY